MDAPATPIMALGPEHADGTIFVDGEGDLWTASPWGWVVTRRVPFQITNQIAAPLPMYGPYRPVLGPPPREDDDDGGGLRDD